MTTFGLWWLILAIAHNHGITSWKQIYVYLKASCTLIRSLLLLFKKKKSLNNATFIAVKRLRVGTPLSTRRHLAVHTIQTAAPHPPNSQRRLFIRRVSRDPCAEIGPKSTQAGLSLRKWEEGHYSYSNCLSHPMMNLVSTLMSKYTYPPNILTSKLSYRQ
jgi:hypothetical protein